MHSNIYVVTDPSAPGLLRYGLHRELSSDTDDTDYEPDKRSRAVKDFENSDSTSSESTAVETSDTDQETAKSMKSKSKVCKILKRKVRKPVCRRLRQLGDDLKLSDDSADSDFSPSEPPVKKLKAKKQSKRSKTRADSTMEKAVNVYHMTEETNDTWSILPTEILSKILFYITANDRKGVLYLCRCSRVCRHWNYLINQPLVWKYVNLSFLGGSKTAKDNILKQLAAEEKLNETKELDLGGWVNLTDDGLQPIIKCCHRLEYLNLSNCQKKTLSKITAPTLMELAENCPLKRITFANLRVSAGFSKAITTFLQLRGDYLTHINLSGNIGLGSAVITVISSVCTNLVSLDLSNTSVRSISIGNLQVTCSKLQELYLANLSLEPKSDSFHPGFPELRICSVARRSASQWLTDRIMADLLKTSTKLNILDVRGNKNITFVGFDVLNSRLQRLYISDCIISLQEVSKICEDFSDSLWDLDVSRTEAYDTSFDIIIETLFNDVSGCKKVSHLNLSGTSVNDSSVKRILKTCARLESLDLTSCRWISRGIKRLHESQENIKNLRKFFRIKN